MIGPHDSSLRRFVNCADKVLEKNREYTIHQAAEICSMDPRTVRNYVLNEQVEVNKWMPQPKSIVFKKNCGCYDGFVVDPPQPSSGNWQQLARSAGVIGASIMIADGVRRLAKGEQLGTTEVALAGAVCLLSILL